MASWKVWVNSARFNSVAPYVVISAKFGRDVSHKDSFLWAQSYNSDTEALRGVDFDVEYGQIFSFLGLPAAEVARTMTERDGTPRRGWAHANPERRLKWS